MSDNCVLIIYIDEENGDIYLEKNKWSNITTDIINPCEGDFYKNIALHAIDRSGFSIKKLYSCSGQYVCSINPFSYYFFRNIPKKWSPFKFEEILRDNHIDKRVRALLENFCNKNNLKEINKEYHTW